MKDKDDKKKAKLLETQQIEDRKRMNEFMATAAKPGRVETNLENEQVNWQDTTSGKNGPLDVRNLSALKPHLNLFDQASQRQEGERMGTGLFRMGAQNTNPLMGQALRSQQDAERQQAASGGLENAFRMTDANMRGSMMPLMGLQQNRTLGLAGMGSNTSAQSTQASTNFRPGDSFWGSLIKQGIGGATQIGAGMASGGTGFFRK